jgi:hypothetical protein
MPRSIVRRVDAGEALAELTGLSSEIRAAALVGPARDVLAATPGLGERLPEVASELLEAAALTEPARTVESVVVELAGGAVFVVCADGSVAVATTGPEPVAALVVHDLRTCLERLAPPPPRPRARRKPAKDRVDA